MTRLCTVIVLTCLLIGIPGHARQSDRPWARGTAWTTDGETLLYREWHYKQQPDDRLPSRVVYRGADGERIARKTLDTSRSAVAPAIDHHDLRTGARVRTYYPDRENLVAVRFREHNSDEVHRQRFRIDEGPLIIDAGFNVFVQRNWQALIAGERITAEFLVASRMNAVGIAVERTDSERCVTPVEPLTCLVAEPTGLLRLAGWLVDPMLLGYHSDSRRLVLFQGTSNIPEADGDNRRVRIHYEYPSRS